MHHTFSDDQIEKNENGGHVARMGGKKRCIQGLVGKAEGKRPLERPRRTQGTACPTELIYLAPKLIKQMLLINLSSSVTDSRFRNKYSRHSCLYHASEQRNVTPYLRSNLSQCANSDIFVVSQELRPVRARKRRRHIGCFLMYQLSSLHNTRREFPESSVTFPFRPPQQFVLRSPYVGYMCVCRPCLAKKRCTASIVRTSNNRTTAGKKKSMYFLSTIINVRIYG